MRLSVVRRIAAPFLIVAALIVVAARAHADTTTVVAPQPLQVRLLRGPEDVAGSAAITRADSIAKATLEQRKREAGRQFYYWIGSGVLAGLGLLFGFGLNAWRNWATQGAAQMVHHDEMFRTHLERFADQKQAASVRVAAAIGLKRLTELRNPLKLRHKDYPFRDDIIRLLVESLATETSATAAADRADTAVLDAIQEQLVEIGLPALQTLVNRHRRWFPAPEDASKPADADKLKESPLFVASRDVIARVIFEASPGEVDSSPEMPSRWRLVKRWRRRPGNQWLDEGGLSDVVLTGAGLWTARLEGAYLTGAHLEGANLGSAHFEGTTLMDAHLDGAYLVAAKLGGADLRSAHLERAILRGAHLEGAYLAEAHLERADLSRAVDWDKAESWKDANWWDAVISDEQRAWFEEHYPRKKTQRPATTDEESGQERPSS